MNMSHVIRKINNHFQYQWPLSPQSERCKESEPETGQEISEDFKSHFWNLRFSNETQKWF